MGSLPHERDPARFLREGHSAHRQAAPGKLTPIIGESPGSLRPSLLPSDHYENQPSSAQGSKTGTGMDSNLLQEGRRSCISKTISVANCFCQCCPRRLAGFKGRARTSRRKRSWREQERPVRGHGTAAGGVCCSTESLCRAC